MIYENILPQNLHQALLNLVQGKTFFWYYQPNIAYAKDADKPNDPLAIPSFGLTHNVWDVELGQVSEVLQYMGPIVEQFQEISKIKINNFIRIKINLLVPIPENSSNKYNGAHIDQYTPHKSLIYYLNDCDGDTFIFNETYNPADQTTWPPLNTPTVKERITPRANSLYYLEDGFAYHSSSNPISSERRFTINFNFN
jgi:hypothetical protein